MTTPPPPLEWHPAYEGHRRRLLHWLNDGGPYRGRDTVLVPRPAPAVWQIEPDPRSIDAALPRPFVLTRHRAAGPAPYVGDSFHYEWWVARDDLGRAIAGDTWIVRRCLPAE
ncbi:hypothetical protein AB0B88_16420 [Micromonospora haikouensis]|uniref:hypothetical protein n=1 Tax=Actinomycetes TaxID=1760 RepID=UPI00340DC072